MIKLIKPVILGLAAAGILAYADPAMPNMTNLQAQLDQLQSKINSMENSADAKTTGVHTNAALTQSLLSVQKGSTGTIETLLKAQKSGALSDGLTLGGFLEAAAINERVSHITADSQRAFETHVSNMRSSTFGAGDTSGQASQIVIPRVEMNLVANLNSWSMGYFSFDIRNLPGDSRTTEQQNLAIDSALMTLGNLNQMPVYVFLGRNTIDFGRFETVNFNTPSLNRLAFQAYGDQLGVGFLYNGLTATISMINDQNNSNAHRNDEVAFNTYTSHRDGIENYAVNVGYEIDFSGVNGHVGLGYLDGSKLRSYDFDTDETEESGAYDLNGKIGFAGFDVLGEFTQTTGAVYNLANNATNDKLRAWDIGADYNFSLLSKATRINTDYSRVSAEYAASQWVLGINQNSFKNIWMGVEYTQSQGRFVSGASCIGAGVGACGAIYSTGSVYTRAYNSVPTSLTTAKDSTILFDVQGVF